MDSVSPLGGDGGYVGMGSSFGSSNTDGAADVFGLSAAPISWVYMLESSGSELRSVSSVYGLEARFEKVSNLDGFWTEFLGETAGEDKEIERWDAVSPSSSSLGARKLRASGGAWS
jgi:hypothetical protein